MSIRNFIDLVLDESAARGGSGSSLSRDRDLIANLLFDRPFSPVAAAYKAGKLPEPQLVEERTQALRKKFGQRVDVMVDILGEALPTYDMYMEELPATTAANALSTSLVPPVPLLDLAEIKRQQAEAKKGNRELEWVTFNPSTIFSGKHLRFVRADGTWYALQNEYFASGKAYLTAEVNNSVFRYRDKVDDEGTHLFLTWVYQNGGWSLQASVHSMVDENERDLSYAEIHEA